MPANERDYMGKPPPEEDDVETVFVMTGEGYRVEHRKIQKVDPTDYSILAGLLLAAIFIWKLVEWMV